MTYVDDIDAAFAEGWSYGSMRKQHSSPAEAGVVLEQQHIPVTPSTETAFCNGSEDGVSGDTWRLDGCCKGAMEREA